MRLGCHRFERAYRRPVTEKELIGFMNMPVLLKKLFTEAIATFGSSGFSRISFSMHNLQPTTLRWRSALLLLENRWMKHLQTCPHRKVEGRRKPEEAG